MNRGRAKSTLITCASQYATSSHRQHLSGRWIPSQAFYKMSQNAAPEAFELQLALVNAYGEVGNVDKCYAHLKEMLARNPQIGALVTWGYNALLKGYRCPASLPSLSFATWNKPNIIDLMP